MTTEDHSGSATGRAALLSALEDLREARRELQRSQARFRTLTERLADRAITAGADGLVHDVNDAALHLLGARREDFLGTYHGDAKAVVRALLASDEIDMPSGEDEWRSKLTPEQYAVLRKGGTEAPFSGKYVNEQGRGMYVCAACGQELFSSDTKFDSGTGWPSFTDPVNLRHVTLHRDESGGMVRTEVRCARCGSHLGHVFDDGPPDKGGKRYCINSVCLLKKPMP